jgi:hypothetical protein
MGSKQAVGRGFFEELNIHPGSVENQYRSEVSCDLNSISPGYKVERAAIISFLELCMTRDGFELWITANLFRGESI